MAGSLEGLELFEWNGRQWAKLNDVVSWVKADFTRPSHITRCFNSTHPDQKLQTINGAEVVPLKALMKFVFHHAHSSAKCNHLADLLVEATQPILNPSIHAVTHATRQPDFHPLNLAANRPPLQPFNQEATHAATHTTSQPDFQPFNQAANHPPLQPFNQEATHHAHAATRATSQPVFLPLNQAANCPPLQSFNRAATHATSRPVFQPFNQTASRYGLSTTSHSFMPHVMLPTTHAARWPHQIGQVASQAPQYNMNRAPLLSQPFMLTPNTCTPCGTDQPSIQPMNQNPSQHVSQTDFPPVMNTTDNQANKKLSQTKIADSTSKKKSLIPKRVNTRTEYDLYQEIVQRKPFGMSCQLSDFDLEFKTTSTIQNCHYEHFQSDKEGWLQICLFENHFGRLYPKQMKPDNIIDKKWAYWNSCKEAQKLSERIAYDAKSTRKNRDDRKDMSSFNKQPVLLAGRRHAPCKVEEDLMQALKLRYDNIEAVIAVDKESSKCLNSIDIYIEMNNETIPESIHEIVHRVLARHHDCSFSTILFMKKNCFEKYKMRCKDKDDDGDGGKDMQEKNVKRPSSKVDVKPKTKGLYKEKVSRFTLRDAIQLGHLEPFILDKRESDINQSHLIDLENDTDEGIICRRCFPNEQKEPLDFESFEVFKEWFLDTPLPVQLLLQSFLNAKTLQSFSDTKTFDQAEQAEKKISYLQKKLQVLYGVYDTLLHVLNKKYLGLMQEANTDELMMGFKSLETVFDVTSGAGATASHSVGEIRLKVRAFPDDLYYAAFLKPYRMTYETDAGLVVHNIRMRDCHVIFMMDNLVRLKYNNDPDRGENRSKQMNLLPVSVQGLPKDCSLVAQWHDMDVCDGTDDCPCKQPKTLTKDDIPQSLFKLSEREHMAQSKFEKMSSWGSTDMWISLLQSSDINMWVQENIVEKGSEDDICRHTSEFSTDIHGNDPVQENVVGKKPGDDIYRQTSVIPEVSDDIRANDLLENIVEKSPDDIFGHTSEVFADPVHDDLVESDSETIDYDISSIASHLTSDSESEAEITSYDFTSDSEDSGSDAKEDDMVLEVVDALDMAHLEEIQRNSEEGKLLYSMMPVLESSFTVISLDNEDQEETSVDDILREKTPSSPKQQESSFDSTNTNMASSQKNSPIATCSLPVLYGFKKFILPPLLTRHPPPYAGRDDDPIKLREILDELLVRMGYYDDAMPKFKILFGPDYKIAQHLLVLVRQHEKYKTFMPEFACLHFRKSRMTIAFSAYKDAGMMQLLYYMKDSEGNDWAQLTNTHHIDVATGNIRRLSFTLHMAAILKFMASLPRDEAVTLLQMLQHANGHEVAERWDARYRTFIAYGTKRNGTFALHVNMMKHLDGILAVALAERLGGNEGYDLLLSSTKQSVNFMFVNGATSYAPYCVQLLEHHYKAGPFYSAMKKCLYSTPLTDDGVNMATDTKREMDHQSITNGFRSGSTLEAVCVRTSLADELNLLHNMRKDQRHPNAKKKKDMLGCELTPVDKNHVIPTVSMILKRNAFSTEEDERILNIYSKEKILLPPFILDVNCESVGMYMIQKYISRARLFSCGAADAPNASDMQGPKDLVRKASQSKGTTLKRMSGKNTLKTTKSVREIKEEKRKKLVAAALKKIDGLSSDMNACQALVKPDCSKPRIGKGTTMANAIKTVLCQCLGDCPKSMTKKDALLKEKNLILASSSKWQALPATIAKSIKVCSLEFAGVVFKSKAISGLDYIKLIEADLITILNHMEELNHLVVIEEKYLFTPDSFKQHTRNQRSAKQVHQTIHHLKTGREILSAERFDKNACITSREGKTLITTYLAKNVDKIILKEDIILDIDSEHYVEGCRCMSFEKKCICTEKFAVPVRCTFQESGMIHSEKLNVKQRKGEAEMAQVDWLAKFKDEDNLQPGEAVASIVTSGDIDAVVIHIFYVSRHWPRIDGRFPNPVYVILQKPSGSTVYNITGIIETLESKYSNDPFIAQKLSMVLCVGGNDFIPKLEWKSHDKICQMFFQENMFRDKLFHISEEGVRIDIAIYIELVKWLYFRKNMGDPKTVTFEDVRKATVQKKKRTQTLTTDIQNANDPNRWMPPKGALQRMGSLIQLQIDYLSTAGNSSALLPNFLGSDCLKQASTGEIEYDFGEESHLSSSSLSEMTMTSSLITPKKGRKRLSAETPQKGARRKLPLKSSTPVLNPKT